MKELKDKIKEWKLDAVKFVREALDGEPDYNSVTGEYSEHQWQTETLNLLVIEDKIAIKSGHGVGKSTLLAWAVLWWIATRYPSKIACTAPTGHQLFDILWSEIRFWRNRMPEWLKKQIEIKSDRVELLGGSSETFAVARTARKENPDALQGFHSPNMLFIIDEASGVDEPIFVVAMGALSTAGAKVLMTGNPTKTSGYFRRSFKRDSIYKNITVSCVGNAFVTKDYIEGVKSEHGEDSNVFRVRVLGEFPTSEDDTLIPYYLVEEAVRREITVEDDHRSVWGLDCARYGNDDSCLVKRRGPVVPEKPKTWSKISTMELVGNVKHEWDITPHTERPERIFVDVIGIGAGVCDRLEELELPVVPVNVSEQPHALLAEANRLRDELWLNCAAWFESKNCKIPDDPRLISEITEIKKKFTSGGKIKVESKDEMKSRGLKSPDKGDALVLTFAEDGAVMMGVMSKEHSKFNEPIRRNLKGVV